MARKQSRNRWFATSAASRELAIRSLATDIKKLERQGYSEDSITRVVLEYGVEGKLLFGSDFPNRAPREAIQLFRNINSIVDGTKLPRIPDTMIDSVLFERPLRMMGLE